MKMKEVEMRLAEIKNELETRGAELTVEEMDALETEIKTLTEERSALAKAAEKRNTMLQSIAGGAGAVVRTFSKPEEVVADPYGTEEYRSAWLKNIRQLPLTDAEKRAYAVGTGTGSEVIPTQTANEIISKVKQLAPMLGEVTLLNVNGAVKFAVEGTNNAAAVHTGNTGINAAADTLTEVTLSGYEIAKLAQVSDSVKSMSVGAFETWIVTMLSEAIASKIEDCIINGTGSSQPTGIEAANTWGATNSVTVGASASLSAANVQTLIGLLNGGYDRNAKILMSKKTLFSDFMPLQDNSKNHIVTVQNDGYYVYGYKVLLSDFVDLHDAYLGDFSKVCANLAENITVKSAYDIDTNSYKYIGVAVFDCKPAIGSAFVKLTHA